MVRKLFKNVPVIILGGLIWLGSAINVNAAVTPPSSYDVNKDGSVNVSDVVWINSVLIGSLTYSDISVFDANQNGVVDQLDRMSIMAYVSEYGITSIIMM